MFLITCDTSTDCDVIHLRAIIYLTYHTCCTRVTQNIIKGTPLQVSYKHQKGRYTNDNILSNELLMDEDIQLREVSVIYSKYNLHKMVAID